jgi:acyl-CoA thioesterase
MQEHRNDALLEALGGMEVESIDADAGVARLYFNVLPGFCHSGGRIAQGGFVTGWIDSAMAHAVIHRTKREYNVASLEIKVSFLEPAGPGRVLAEGRIRRLGRRVAFLEGSLYSEDGSRLLATATSTAMLVPYARG